MKPATTLLIAAAAALTAGAAQAQDWSTIRIGTEGAYPPWNATSPAGELIGFEVDLARDLCQRMNAECTFVAQDWDGIIPALQTGKYDIIMAGMSITDERREVVSFSRGYATTPAFFVAAKDSDLHDVATDMERVDLAEVSAEEEAAIEALREALDGATVGVQSATIHANFLEEYMGDVVDVRLYDTQENLNLDLVAGRIDAGLADGSAWQAFFETPEGEAVAIFGPGFQGGVFGEGVGAAFRKSDEDLLAMFDEALAEAKQDGTVARLATEWFGFDASMP